MPPASAPTAFALEGGALVEAGAPAHSVARHDAAPQAGFAPLLEVLRASLLSESQASSYLGDLEGAHHRRCRGHSLPPPSAASGVLRERTAACRSKLNCLPQANSLA